MADGKQRRVPPDPALEDDLSYLADLKRVMRPIKRRVARRKLARFVRYRLAGTVVVVAMIACMAYVSNGAYRMYGDYLFVHKDTLQQEAPDTVYHYRTDSTMTLRNFIKQIAFGESRYDPRAVRPGSKYMGLYQFSPDVLRITGYDDLTREQIENHPAIQTIIMIALLKFQKKNMQAYIDKYSGKIVDGLLVTESGILALCQLGDGYTRGCLDSGRIPREDEHGNHPRDLMKLGGYVLNLDRYNDEGYEMQINEKR